ncbi:hypothetical protein pdul_cds_880 [Pandoravirus dulcis]|uniref:Uncharacterized protein n=1 Tax=Pandoravirus dulcis TaxID=1349409 RepID=S4VS36_9VIRU|nr:hypothetical protein pdul_cds_880 [Pandoravirus dulcis]AGO83102.1 hypothetical protein pdul_cds_880 [Pandoravirus dulcis]
MDRRPPFRVESLSPRHRDTDDNDENQDAMEIEDTEDKEREDEDEADEDEADEDEAYRDADNNADRPDGSDGENNDDNHDDDGDVSDSAAPGSVHADLDIEAEVEEALEAICYWAHECMIRSDQEAELARLKADDDGDMPDSAAPGPVHAHLDVKAEVAALDALCYWARERIIRSDQEDELERLKAGDVLGDVRLADADPTHGSDTDTQLIERYRRMWQRLADSKACVAHMSTVASGWPPTLADVERAYRDLDAAYRRRCHGGDHIGDGEDDPARTLITYLAAEARAGHPYPGDILADAVSRALERSNTLITSRRWPQYPDPFGGRLVPRHAHGSACVSSGDIDVDYFVLVACRSDTAEAVLMGVPEAGRARAIAGASLLHEAPPECVAASMPVDATDLCRCVRPYVAMLPAFLGAVAAALHKPVLVLPSEDRVKEEDVALADGAWHVSSAMQAMPSMYDAPHSVIQAVDEIDDRPYAWRQAEQLFGLRLEPGQLALALSLAAGTRAATMVDLPASSLADRAATAYDGPLDAPGLCAEAGALVAARIWRRVCADGADGKGQLPDGERLIEIALALDIAPTDAERAVPELLCGRLIEPIVRATMRARGMGMVGDVRVPDASGHTLGALTVQGMAIAARLAPEEDPRTSGAVVLADAITQRGGHVDPGITHSHSLAEVLTRTLWPSANRDECDAWARLYAADPTSRPDPDDAALMEALASRMGIPVDDHHRATAGALCGLLALAVHWPS